MFLFWSYYWCSWEVATGYKYYSITVNIYVLRCHNSGTWCHMGATLVLNSSRDLVKINRFDTLATFDGTIFVAMWALKFCKIIFNLNSITATCSTCNSARSMTILTMSSVLNDKIMPSLPRFYFTWNFEKCWRRIRRSPQSEVASSSFIPPI